VVGILAYREKCTTLPSGDKKNVRPIGRTFILAI